MQLWNNFAAKHPAAAKWVREGGLFVIVSNLVTVFKYLLLQFLPAAFSSLPVVDFGWPGIPVTLFGETFQWNILGYDSAHGGLPYFCAYMVALETVNNAYLGGDASLACSERTAATVDDKVVEVVKQQHEKAKQMLIENRGKLDEIAKYLYEKETITGEEFMRILTAVPQLPTGAVEQ